MCSGVPVFSETQLSFSISSWYFKVSREELENLANSNNKFTIQAKLSCEPAHCVLKTMNIYPLHLLIEKAGMLRNSHSSHACIPRYDALII
jgi:hypothetical protein